MSLQKARFLIAFVLTLLVAASFTGCSGNRQDQEPIGLIPFGDETTLPDLPRDSIDVLLEQVGAGDLTLAEGVVENLKLMAGEIAFEDLYGDQNLRLESGWGLSLLAQEVLENSNDDKVKAEIVQLLNIIAPPQNNLDHYAVPDEDYAARGFAKVALTLMSPPNQSVICASISSDGFPLASEDPPVCLLYRSFSAGGHEYRVYFPEEKRSDPNYMRYVDAAVVGLKDAQVKLSPFSEVPDINLVFTLLPSSFSPSALAAATIPGVGSEVLRDVACPVIVYPSAIDEDLDELKFTVAHEVFHCISMLRKGYTGYASAAWYQEGMAEYFANVVYPEMNIEHSRLSFFDQNSGTIWLMDMSYENVVFFQYLENRFDPNYILGLHDALPRWDPPSAQATALSEFDDMQAIFHDFAKAYFSGTIHDTGGGTLSMNILVAPENVFEIGEGMELNLSSSAFMLARFALNFDEGIEYEITKDTGGDDGRNAWRKREDDIFSEIPETFNSSCSENPSYLVILTTAPAGANQSSETELDLDFKSNEEAKMDCCLIGTWEQRTGEIRSNLATIVSGSGMSIHSVTGRFLLTVTEEKIMTFFPENYSLTLVNPDGDLITARVVGMNTNTFIIPEKGEIIPANDNSNFVIYLESGGGSMTIPLGATSLGGGPFSSGDSFSYTCDERTFTSSTEGKAPFSSSSFTRLSPVPETPSPPEDFPDPFDPESSGSPDIGSTSACLLISANDFATLGNTTSWRLNNGTDASVEIHAISGDWPASNGSLEEILLDGVSIWEGDESFSPARIDGPWRADQILSPGADAELVFRYNPGPAESSPYILVVDFTNGCILSDVR